MLLAAACFATSDATVKYLGQTMPVVLLLWARYLVQALVMVTVQARRRAWRELLASQHLPLQGLRALLLLGNAACSFFGIQHLPLAEFTALAMLAPVATTLLANFLLHEKVGHARWVIVALGFAGMLLVVRPGSGALGWGVAFPVAGAVLFAAFQIVTSRLMERDDMVTTNMLSGLTAWSVLCLLLLIFPTDALQSFERTGPVHWALVLCLGSVATLGQILLAMAIRTAPVSTLTPFGYSQIAFAALISWLVFSQQPDRMAAAGMLLIAISGALTVWLSHRSARRAHEHPSTRD